MAKKDLMDEVERLNKKYCKRSTTELHVAGAYGGYRVELRSKEKNRKCMNKKLGSGVDTITLGYLSPSKTLNDLHREDSYGEIKRKVREWEDAKPTRKMVVKKSGRKK